MGEVGNESETIPACDRRLFPVLAGNWSHGIFGVLQHYRQLADVPRPFVAVPLKGGDNRDRLRTEVDKSGP
jgi:hypothetical protein